MNTAELPSYADIAQALFVSLAKHAHCDLHDVRIDLLDVERDPVSGAEGGWDVAFVVLPPRFNSCWDCALSEVHTRYPRARPS